KAQVPFLLGGAYAYCVYTGIARHTKDFDLFVRQEDFERALAVLQKAGYRTEKTFPHWLGKAFQGDDSIDIIFRAGNGLCAVNDRWFERARQAEVFGTAVRLSAPEEIIWMKAYIMERERYDGADVAHLFWHCAAAMDWEHLLRIFGPDWRVLLSHLILFGFIYPAERDRIPKKILSQLLLRLEQDEPANTRSRLCRGTLLSRSQFLPDVRDGNFRDARLEARSHMTPAEIEAWTAAADPHLKPRTVSTQD
ncbi:MAG TPA: nucleotidyltransferase family protein, partial [Chthoniobacterales bacterium]|nr:nucleotidyltransferase family protein [Chthoniobacterales bacterium]